MSKASERLEAERKAALEARFWQWHLDRVAEDRGGCVTIPVEFRSLVHPNDWYPNGRRDA